MRKIRVLMIVTLLAGIGLIGVQQAVSQKAAKSATNAEGGGLLTGTVRSASGAEEGITVSARVEGSPITTTVFTDQDGVYIFPQLEKGKYQVWAQAVGLMTGRADADLNGATVRQDFTLKPAGESVVQRQMTGADWFASLPESTKEDRRVKDVFMTSCTGCHQPSYPLQNRFDNAGWSKIIDLMKKLNVIGIYSPTRDPYPIMSHHQQALAEYLGKVRGPDSSSLKVNLVSRPKGEATMAVITEYAITLSGAPNEYPAQDGNDWSEGVPSSMNGVRGTHEVEIDFNGTIWVATSQGNPNRTYAKIDPNTGAITSFKVVDSKNKVRQSHGMRKDGNGIIWLSLSGATDPAAKVDKGALARLDPATEKIDIYTPPDGMTGLDNGAVEIDGKGKIWSSTRSGAERFDPATGKFMEFKSVNLQPMGKGQMIGASATYGVAGDAQGNGYWAQMGLDIVGKGDVATGKSFEIKMPPRSEKMEIATAEERKLYDEVGSDWNSAIPWSQAPRRLSGDRTGNAVWVANSWGETLGKIDIRTNKVTLYPVPKYSGIYATVVDNKHMVWTNLMNNDSVARFDPSKEKWTEYMLPTHGAETRHIAINDKQYPPEVLVPYSRTNKVARLRFRTKQDLDALKRQVRPERLQAKN